MKHFSLFLFILLPVLFTGCGLFKPVDSTGGTRSPGSSGSASGGATAFIRADIVDHAKELMGLRYKYGGNKPSEGFDCSGFVLYLYQNAGIDINRVSRDQAKQGKSVPLSKARPGDLVFFKRNGKAVHHVSVIVETGINKLIVVHATNSGVIRENILESRYWEPMLYQVRDILD
ncbi:NlpC/P60 family protein [Neolewinella aurantiaca]|uniref:NlpC/P60 family protein n=1 Tax=Neolewinella aurantiaca TaxID=2602767 RepID=A0A5C7FLQ1_9BACT|nr:C40 family peptidase [Neolewinella aurantiaca]TXF88292.1 NlpC/P60 family protein [Neolewinella aurantiaca]